MTILDDVDSLANRVLLAAGEGDWAPYYLPGSEVRFAAGSTAALKTAFNVPVDADFYADFLNLYLQYRVVDPVTPAQSDVVFRPCNWSCVSEINTGDPFRQATVLMFLKDYQSAPVDIAALFSTPYGLAFGGTSMPMTLYVGGMDVEGLIIPRGTTAEADLTPVFSSGTQILNPPDGALGGNFAVEFRVVSRFQGRKNVRAFR